MKKSKVIKMLIVLYIILYSSFEVCASIMVSDGSAFVTKAEFSADLNNMSKRLTEVENGLEAKIDNLVSSYLSRNGIWNGVDQLDNVYKAKDIALQFNLQGRNTSANAMTTMKNLKINDTLIRENSKLNKTGLLFISHKFVSNNNEIYMWTRGSTGFASSNYKVNIYCAIKIKTNVANSQYIERVVIDGLAADCEAIHYSGPGLGDTFVTNSSTNTVRAGYGTVKLLYANDWAAQDIMFVQKDAALVYEIVATASGNTGECFVGAKTDSSNFGKYYVTAAMIY
jgi:hypothetical protein